MANLDPSNPQPAADPALAARTLTETPPEPPPRGQLVDLAEMRRRRNAVARRSWRPKGW